VACNVTRPLGGVYLIALSSKLRTTIRMASVLARTASRCGLARAHLEQVRANITALRAMEKVLEAVWKQSLYNRTL
jgi:hypothetical protein